MSGTMRIRHEGAIYEVPSIEEWHEQRRRASLSEVVAEMDQAVRHGVILRRDGTPLTGHALTTMRHRLLDTYGGFSRFNDGLEDGGLGSQGADLSGRYAIPGLWKWPHKPLITGVPKTGRTRFVANLAAALAVPGYRFLDRFEPARLTYEERVRGVWVVNPDHPEADFMADLDEAGALAAHPAAPVIVTHLSLEGGPAVFDLSDPANVTRWADHMTYCQDGCDDGEVITPSVVLVDDVTSILQHAGKDPTLPGSSGYGPWFAGFRDLLTRLDTPLGAAVGHSYATQPGPVGGVSSEAAPDGLWSYTRDAKGRRWFGVSKPRGKAPIVPPMEVVIGDDGRLVVRSESGPSQQLEAAAEPKPADPGESVESAVLAYVGRCNEAGHGPVVREVRAQGIARNPDVDAALSALIEGGRLTTRPRRARGGGIEHWLPGR